MVNVFTHDAKIMVINFRLNIELKFVMKVQSWMQIAKNVNSCRVLSKVIQLSLCANVFNLQTKRFLWRDYYFIVLMDSAIYVHFYYWFIRIYSNNNWLWLSCEKWMEWQMTNNAKQHFRKNVENYVCCLI